MRCKQGDLAYIVNGEGSRFKPEPENLGRVVTCVCLVPFAGMGPVWKVEAHGDPIRVALGDGTNAPGLAAWMEDANLRPLSANEQTLREERMAEEREQHEANLAAQHRAYYP